MERLWWRWQRKRELLDLWAASRKEENSCRKEKAFLN